jgi:NAD(P)-dependent dehydrogenase (short-subunit alcohol dehydrogenase family)
MKRAGTAQEIAHAFVFLTSDKVDHISGQIIGVNGGKTAS